MHPTAKMVWNLVPSVVQDFVASTIDRVNKVPIPPPPLAQRDRRVRLYIGPTNYAGQGHRWARAAAENPDVDGRNMVCLETNPFGYATDYSVRWRTMEHSRRWQRDLFAELTEGYTHVMIEAESPILGGMFGADIRRQVAALRARGVTVGMICHGTDIRLPSRHKALEQWSYFSNDDWTPVAPIEKIVLSNMALLDDIAAPTFVSTPGLLLDVPFAHLLPVVIEPDLWANSEPLLENKRLRVVHIPSNPLPKGTMHIAPALERLQSEGIVDYIHVTGKTQAEMPAMYAGADVVLDQFRAGDYGVASCEAMASGRLVVAHVSEQARGVVLQETGLELPILEANIDTLEDVIRDIAVRRDYYRTIAARGPAFIRHAHDGRMSRAVLEQHFLSE